MNSQERAVAKLGEDIISSWGELHNEVKALRINAGHIYDDAMRLEKKIDAEMMLLSDACVTFPH